jgi:hypothetical protein
VAAGYTVSQENVGQALSCRVTARNNTDSAGATSDEVTAPAPGQLGNPGGQGPQGNPRRPGRPAPPGRWVRAGPQGRPPRGAASASADVGGRGTPDASRLLV